MKVYSVSISTKQIKANLKAVPNWSQKAHAIYRTFNFDGFMNSIIFVNRIARRAQRLNHYPRIDVCFNQVTLTFVTNDENGITEKNFSLARQCDEIFAKFSP
jgi:4a-hydroxytetrahydrobiopterin dehydratase